MKVRSIGAALAVAALLALLAAGGYADEPSVDEGEAVAVIAVEGMT